MGTANLFLRQLITLIKLIFLRQLDLFLFFNNELHELDEFILRQLDLFLFPTTNYTN